VDDFGGTPCVLIAKEDITMNPIRSSGETISAYAALQAGQAVEAYRYVPKALGPNDVEIAVSHCGMCHTDLHLAKNDFGISSYPLVPGHEIVGQVAQLGSVARGLDIGQRVGVGWLAGACFACQQCDSGHDNICPKGQPTCVGHEGGYATHVRVDARFAFPIPDALPSEAAAPLFCGGITVFAPLLRHASGVSRVGVIGIGGLGHLALQYARALGCHVTAFSTSPTKADAAKRFGAHEFVSTAAPDELKAHASTCDLLLSTVSADVPWKEYLTVLRPGGKLAILGVPSRDVTFAALPLILARQSIVMSPVGSRSEIKAMLEFSARHRIVPQVEVFPMSEVNAVLERLAANELRYRAVLANPS
jgi:uncharacterized zinc-type alcohol dehydrogenase-like protein